MIINHKKLDKRDVDLLQRTVVKSVTSNFIRNYVLQDQDRLKAPVLIDDNKPDNKKLRLSLKLVSKFLNHSGHYSLKNIKKPDHYLPLAFSIFVLVSFYIVGHQPNFYFLTQKQQSVLGSVNDTLASQLSYSSSKKAFTYNLKGVGSAETSNLAKTTYVGGGAKDYAVDLPANINKKSVTVYDTTAKIANFDTALSPLFNTRLGKISDGRVVYPLKGINGKLIYNLADNGLEENILINKFSKKTISFSYKLNLPKTLQAKMMSDGNIGVYSANPILYGNISYGSSQDATLLNNARQNSKKTYLAFIIPTPSISQTSRYSVGDIHPEANSPNYASAKFKLVGNDLTIIASDLNRLDYPISIDPSIVVNSANGLSGGNDEYNIATNPSGYVTRGNLTGGTTGTWTTSTNYEQYASMNYSSMIYVPVNSGSGTSGYVYVNPGDLNIGIQYAPVNSSGNVTSGFTATSNLNSVAGGGSMVYYNGYLYVVGGNTSSTNFPGNVQYAQVNSNGTLGPFTTSSSTIPLATNDSTVVASNGYLYDAGGCTSDAFSYCSSTTNSVTYAPINANGSIGTWNAINSTGSPNMSNAHAGGGGAIYNGYFYVYGGIGSDTTEYAPINSATGAIGTWTVSSNNVLSTDTGQGVGYAYNGYLYWFPDNNTTSLQYAPIYSNGTTGIWQQNLALPAAANSGTSAGMMAVMPSGIIIVSQGTASGSDAMWYGSIETAGMTGTYTTSSNTFSSSSPVFAASSVAYRGCLYAVGGTNTSGNSKSIYDATLSSNGSVGTWNTNSYTYTSNNGRSGTALAVYDGYLYVIAGSETTEIDYAAFNTTGCGTGAFTSIASGTGSVPTANQFAGAVAYDGYLYLAGGVTSNNSNNLSQVIFAQINPNGSLNTTLSSCPNSGTLYNATWCSTTSLPVATAEAPLLENDGYLYDVVGNGTNTVYYTSINTTNGTIGSWIDANASGNGGSGNSFNTARFFTGATVYDGYLYINGGSSTNTNSGTIYGDTQYAPINSNGSLGTWTTSFSLNTARAFNSLVASNGYLYSIGGCSALALIMPGCSNSADTLDNVEYASINNGGGGLANFSANSNSMATGVTAFGHAVVVNGYVYVVGGCDSVNNSNGDCNNTSSVIDTVQYAPISQNGIIGAWSSTSTLPTSIYEEGVVAYNGVIYVVGGCTTYGNAANTCGTTNSTIYAAQPSTSNGTISSWSTSTGTTNYECGYQQLVADNGYIYALGGANGSCSNAIGSAAISSSNPLSVGSFNNIGSLPSGAVNQGLANVINYDGYIYYFDANSNENLIDSAAICTTTNSGTDGCTGTSGTLGTWQVAGTYEIGRGDFSVAANNGFIYLFGGYNGTVDPDSQYAAVLPGGKLASWQYFGSGTTTAAPYDNISGAMIDQDGTISIIGGYEASTSVYSTVYSSPTEDFARNGMYSYNLVYSGYATPSDFQYTGYTPSIDSSIGIGYELAPVGSSAYGSLNSINVLPSNLTTNNSYSLYSGFNGVQDEYMWLSFNLNDSQSAVFPDSTTASASYLSSFQLFYHPAPNTRLRGGVDGSSLTPTSSGSLDATPD